MIRMMADRNMANSILVIPKYVSKSVSSGTNQLSPSGWMCEMKRKIIARIYMF